MKLVILARQTYLDYFRIALIDAAERQGTSVLYVALLPHLDEVQLFRAGKLYATHRYRGSFVPVINEIAAFAANDTLILFHSSAYANAVKILRLRLRFRRAIFVFDVFDDYFYDADGVKLLTFKTLDRLYRVVSQATVLLSSDLATRYPSGFHLDNASHLTPVANSRDPISSRVAVMSSFDKRFDGEWLRRLAMLLPEVEFHLHGWVHHANSVMARELENLVEACPNLTYFGAYRNVDLAPILSRYHTGILPYRAQHPLTRYINPDKIYHYLCAGMEVVSTPIPQASKMLEYIHVCREPESAAETIRLILGAKLRKNPGDLHTRFNWTVRWHELRTFLETRV